LLTCPQWFDKSLSTFQTWKDELDTYEVLGTYAQIHDPINHIAHLLEEYNHSVWVQTTYIIRCVSEADTGQAFGSKVDESVLKDREKPRADEVQTFSSLIEEVLLRWRWKFIDSNPQNTERV